MHLEVETRQGTLRGLSRAGHHAFLGVPFAAPPVGELRFAPPRAPAAWAGVRDATAYGASAPQELKPVPGFTATGPTSEDCLYLNVYTPACDGAKRPVMFWIHGGGFSLGSGSEPTYDGGALAVRGDVVVVAINYRLGALGYLYLGGHGGAEWGAAANAGQLDQIAALRWVRDNIAVFGGDPEQVTIFGESAGSVAVCTLLAMPEAQGLFGKAIAQSGTANRLHDTRSAGAIAGAYLKDLGLSSADPRALRAAPLHDLLEAQGARGMLSPVVDGRTLPQRAISAVREGFAKSIPLMVGTNRDELKLYAPPKRGELDEAGLAQQVAAHLPPRARGRVAEVIALYRASRAEHGLPAGNHDVVDAVGTDSRMRIPALRLCEAQIAHQPRTFSYLFDWESPARGGALGACHGLEIPFVFGTLRAPGMDRFCGKGPEADRLCEQMMDAWIAFAKTGDPSHAAIGRWPAYEPGARQTMIFGRHARAIGAPFEAERALWDSLLDARG
jgi:para-nitrobenzyl esterase